MCFERVHILFDFLHPHKHPEVLGSGAPQTRRLSIHRNEPRTTAELRYAFQIRDPCDVKTFAGYHYFGVEYVLRDLSTERLRRSLAIFCTDHPDDHRKWRDFWEEMQVRYPMVRNRSATSMPMDMSSELMSEFLLPSQAARRAVEGQSKQDTDSVSSSCLPSPINQDDDSLTGTRTPEWTDSEHRQLHSRGSTPPPPFVLLGSTTTDGVHQNLLGNLRAGDEKVQAESIAQWIALLVDAERQAREGIELIEAATHSLLEANQKLRDLAYHVLPAATFPPSMGLACGKGEGSACDGTSGGVSIRDGDTIHSLQAELKELLVALEEVKSAAAYPTSAPEALASAESVAASNQELLATYERELAELRAQNATLKSKLDTHAAIATERVERALDEWTRAGVVDIADGDTAHEGSGRRGTNVVSPASRQRYLTADEALLRALIEVALGRESSTAAFAASSGSSSSAQVSTQDGSASDLQASHSAPSINANEHDGAITGGQSLGTASDSHQPWGALSRDARLSSAMSAAGALTASLPELVQQHLSTFAAEHDRRLGGPDSAPSSSIEGVLYHVVDEVVTAFNHMVDVPETVEGVSNADGSVAAPAREITAVSSWLSVLHRCLLHRVDVVEAVRATGTRDKSLLSAAEFGGSTADAGGAVDSTAAEDGAIQCRPPAAASSNTRRRGSLPPLTDEEISIIGDLRRSVHDLVAWILDLLAERQQYATSVAALDSMTCQHDVFQPLKEVQAELERTIARFEAAAAVESLDNVAYRHRGVTTPDILPLEAAAASSGADGDPEYSEKHTAGSSDTLKVEHRLKARLQHAMSAFDSACAEAVALRRLLTTILYGSEVPLRSADSTDGVGAAATTNAAAACEAFRAAQDAGIDGVDKLRGAAEASVAVRSREEVWANTLTPAVLQACADALVGGPCIQDVVHSLQLILGRCPEIDGSPKWVGGTADVLPLSKESIWSLVQELHQRLAAEQARCNKLLGGVMLISASLASSESELLAAAYSTAMAATANASAMTDEALKSWAAYSNNSNEVTPEEQRCLHEPAETKANPRLSSFPAACGGENALHEAVHTDLVVTLTSAEGARDLRSAALDAACSLLPNLSARIADTQTTLWRLVGDLLLHGAGTGVPSLEVLLALPIVNHTGVPTAVDASEKDGVSLGDHMRVAGNAVEELLSGSEEAARRRREWMQQLLRWLKDFPLASASDAAPELASGLQCDASTAHEVYAQLLEELAAAESELMSRVGAVGALLRKARCVHTISVPEMGNEAGGADIAVLAAAASADIAEALHVSEAHISVTEASVDPVQRVVQVSATIAHHPHALTRAAVLGSVHACPCARLREALKDAPANSATTASSMNEQSTARPVTVDSPEGMDAVSCLSTSLLHRAAKIAAVVEFEKRVLALLPTAQDTAVANVRMSTIDAMQACKAGQTLAAMLATELDINPPEANFEVPPTVFPSLLQSLASYLQELHDIVLPVLHHRIINPEKASLEKLRTAVDALHDAAIEKMPHVSLEQLSCIDNTTGMLWPEALNTANLRDLHFVIDHLSTTAKQAVSLNFTDDLFHHLRATAESLGVPPDAYAGECSGERVPTTAQLAERAGAVVRARAEEAAGLRSIAESLGVSPDAYAGECSGERVPTAAQLAERAGAVVRARAEEAAGLCSIAESLGVSPDAYAGECSGERVPTAAQLAERAGAVVRARAEEAAGLCSIAESLGVSPDAYAGECSGERVPTTAQLAERAGAVVRARAEEAAGLCSIAESLGVSPDAYAGECSGERVPTTAQLAERAGAVVRARAEEAAGLCSIAESLGVSPDAYAGECSGERVPTAAQLAERAGAVVRARAEEAAGLCSIAESLGVSPDAYAGECSGERVPTAAQLAERAGAVVRARAEEAAGLCSIAESLGVSPDAYAGECSGERVPTAAQLAERAGAVVRARAEEAAGLRSIAESLGVSPDAYAGECSGERVPTTAQLAERAGAVVRARAEEAAGLCSIAESLGVSPDAYAGECSGERVPTAAQLAERAGAVVRARAEEAAGLCSIAESLGVSPDAYAGECSGERVPTTAQLAERAGAVVRARAEEAAGLCSIAESLGVSPDAYAGECSGERVPTAAQLAERAGAVVRARAEEAAGLRSIAESLGVSPDAYAGECSGERVPTAAQLAERAGAVVRGARRRQGCAHRESLGVSPDAYAGECSGERVPTTAQLAERAGAVVRARAEEAAGLSQHRREPWRVAGRCTLASVAASGCRRPRSWRSVLALLCAPVLRRRQGCAASPRALACRRTRTLASVAASGCRRPRSWRSVLALLCAPVLRRRQGCAASPRALACRRTRTLASVAASGCRRPRSWRSVLALLCAPVLRRRQGCAASPRALACRRTRTLASVAASGCRRPRSWRSVLALLCAPVLRRRQGCAASPRALACRRTCTLASVAASGCRRPRSWRSVLALLCAPVLRRRQGCAASPRALACRRTCTLASVAASGCRRPRSWRSVLALLCAPVLRRRQGCAASPRALACRRTRTLASVAASGCRRPRSWRSVLALLCAPVLRRRQGCAASPRALACRRTRTLASVAASGCRRPRSWRSVLALLCAPVLRRRQGCAASPRALACRRTRTLASVAASGCRRPRSWRSVLALLCAPVLRRRQGCAASPRALACRRTRTLASVAAR
ncbi:hypothetical protein NXY56_007186 [Leishmania guyanensis]